MDSKDTFDYSHYQEIVSSLVIDSRYEGDNPNGSWLNYVVFFLVSFHICSKVYAEVFLLVDPEDFHNGLWD